MPGPEFFQTPMGHRFYEAIMPRIAEALQHLAGRKAHPYWVETFDGGLVNLAQCLIIGEMKAMDGEGWIVYADDDRKRIQLTAPVDHAVARAFLNHLGAHLGALMQGEGSV